jgi:DNA alkylation repair enzyme
MTKNHPFIPPLVHLIRSELQRHADSANAAAMQRYMKTTQPFYGVPSPLRKELFRQALKIAPLTCRADYETAIRQLWSGTCREEMYMALEVAEIKTFHTEESWPLYEKLVETAPHWDTLDWLAGRIVGPLVLRNRNLEKHLVTWSDSPNLWVRRASPRYFRTSSTRKRPTRPYCPLPLSSWPTKKSFSSARRSAGYCVTILICPCQAHSQTNL